MQSTDSVQSLSKFQWYFHRNKTSNPKTYIETQKTMNSQSNLEREQSWRHHALWFQTIGLAKKPVTFFLYNGSTRPSLSLTSLETILIDYSVIAVISVCT